MTARMICRTIRVFILCTLSLMIIDSFWTDRVSAMTPPNYFERNSSYAERQWNITCGDWLIEDRHMEDCLLKLAPKHSTWFSKGALCGICARVISKKFPSNESIKLSYDLDVGIDRFYLTKGVEEHSAHFLKTTGSKNHKYTFILDDYITYDHNNSTQDSLKIKSGS